MKKTTDVTTSTLVIPAIERKPFVQEVSCSLQYQYDPGVDPESSDYRSVVLMVGSYRVARLVPGEGLELIGDLPGLPSPDFPFPVCKSNINEIIVYPEYGSRGSNLEDV